MKNQPRVLGYCNAVELNNEDLKKISGGIKKSTIDPTNYITGMYPGTLDAETDQIWD